MPWKIRWIHKYNKNSKNNRQSHSPELGVSAWICFPTLPYTLTPWQECHRTPHIQPLTLSKLSEIHLHHESLPGPQNWTWSSLLWAAMTLFIFIIINSPFPQHIKNFNFTVKVPDGGDCASFILQFLSCPIPPDTWQTRNGSVAV